MARFFTVLMIALLASACSVFGGGDDSSEAPSGGEAAFGVINWTRTPETIVFRADVVGGEQAQTFAALNEVPNCTIYGDNRVIWTSTAGDNSTQILIDILTDEVIYNFVADLTVADRIYTYTTGVEDLPPASVSPVVETLFLNVNGREHQTDAFGGWTYPYWEAILNRCTSLSQAPALFEPTEAWLTVREVEYSTNFPSRLWDEAAAQFDLAEVAASEAPRWITGDVVRQLWNLQRSGGPETQFAQGTGNYVIALQIPNVTRDAPARP